MPVKLMDAPVIDKALVHGYRQYVELRIGWLLERYRKFPDFPGVQTGYNSITGEEFVP